MFDIITFGSAANDIFIKIKNHKLVSDNDFSAGKGICFSFGSKIEIDEIAFATGGGGTNTAVAFALQGFKTAFCGKIGEDMAGERILKELKEYGVNTSLVAKSKKPTNHSIIFQGQERTILAYRGASEDVTDFAWGKLKAKWFYIASLSQNVDKIIDIALSHKTKIVLNPGKVQLPNEILSKADILVLNQEEAAFLTKLSYNNEHEVFKKIDEICPGIAIMTKGSAGVTVSDGKYLYSAKPIPSDIVDTTGAGDSFASGFVSGYIQSKGDIVYSIQFGIANASGCLSKLGSKLGLLKNGQEFVKVEVKKEECQINGLCQPKHEA